MNTVLHQSTTRARGLALGLLLMTALVVGTTPARADEVTAYGAYPANQLAEQRSALDGSMQRTAELAQRALAAELKLSLKQQVRPTKVAMTIKAERGRG
jgi:hypothetical protein